MKGSINKELEKHGFVEHCKMFCLHPASNPADAYRPQFHKYNPGLVDRIFVTFNPETNHVSMDNQLAFH